MTEPEDKKSSFRKLPIILLIAAILAFLFIFRNYFSEEEYKYRTYHIARGRESPIPMMGKERNLLGFIEDLIVTISKEQKIKISIDTVETNQLMELLNHERYDGIVSTTQPNLLDERRYDFSDPLYLIGLVLIVPIDSKVTSLEQLDGQRIAIQGGTEEIDTLSKIAPLTFISYDNMNSALTDVYNHQISGALMSAPAAYSAVQSSYADKLKIVTKPLTTEGIRIIVLLNEPDSEFLIETMNRGLSELKESSTYQKLLNKWDLTNFER